MADFGEISNDSYSIESELISIGNDTNFNNIIEE
jgi:hypothetical protein